jgi:PAS domain S-box-containing protein
MRRSTLGVYVQTLLLVVALTLVKTQVPAIGQRLPFLLYFGVVIYAAWRGGRGPAAFAIVASVAAANGFFLDPGIFVLPSGLFVAEGILIAEVCEAMRRSRSAAFESASRLDTTLRSIDDAVIATDVEGRIVFMNPNAARITGVAENEAKGKTLDSVFEAVDEGTRERIEGPVPRVLREGKAVGLTNHTIVIARGAGGEETPIDCSGAPIRDPSGSVSGVVLVFRNVAPDKRRTTQRDILAEVTSTLAGSLDLEATLARVASLLVPRFADWCAVELKKAEGGGTEQLAVAHVDPKKVAYAEELRRKYPPDPAAPSGVPNVLRTGKAEHYPDIPDELLVEGAKDAEHLRISRELALRSAIIVPLTARGKTFGALTMVYAESGRRYTETDVAFAQQLADRAALAVDNARLFSQERAAREMADTATRLKDEFLATLSHELRTPLTAVLGWSRMLSDGTLDDAKKTRALATIDRNAVAMAQLVDDLLDVSRIISGKLRIDSVPTALAPIVDSAIESVKPAAQAKAIVIKTNLEDASPVMGDARRLQQVIWNLLSNAVKFTPRGGRVEVTVARKDSTLELCVVDTGKGIAESFLPFVFDRFRQQDASFTRSAGGLGLGLAITRHLVELHGGTIEAESEGKDRGAKFVIRLPIAAVASPGTVPVVVPRQVEALVRPAPAEIERPPELRGKKVLVVDDDDDARNLVATVLTTCGCDVATASSVGEAMARFDDMKPDVVVSDIGMPNEDGFELIKRIRARPADRGGKVPAAALTAYARADDRRRVLAAGFVTHVVKPVDPSELVAVIASLVRLS